MTINRKVLSALGNPDGVSFWLEKEKAILLISDAPENTRFTIEIGRSFYDNDNKDFTIEDDFFMKIKDIVGWHKDTVYIVAGNYIPRLNAVSFNLYQADILDIEPDTGKEPDA
jgi:hypothetical protein